MRTVEDCEGDRQVDLMLLLLGAGKLERDTPHCIRSYASPASSSLDTQTEIFLKLFPVHKRIKLLDGA